jgi:cell shape-determining protein MreC
MRIYELQTIKPLTPQQARVSALKQQKERASDMLKAEKDRQKQQKATKAIQKNNDVLAKINHS